MKGKRKIRASLTGLPVMRWSPKTYQYNPDSTFSDLRTHPENLPGVVLVIGNAAVT